MYVKLQYNNFS